MNIQTLRNKIKNRASELAIEPAHDSTGHWYRYKDQLYPGVTAKLSLLKDAGLANWKMNRALEYVEFAIRQHPVTADAIDATINQAKLVPQQEFEGAGDIGTAVHGWREEWFNETWPAIPSVTDERPEVKASCKAIENCVSDNNIQPLACELFLADDKLKLGGTLDDVWRVGNENWLIDLKTSNIGNKDSYYLQVATYWKMFRRLYKIKIDKLFILHTSKTRFGDYQLIPIRYPQRYWKMAETVYKLYDNLEELKELKRPEGVRI